jgi:hypothetical protein
MFYAAEAICPEPKSKPPYSKLTKLSLSYPVVLSVDASSHWWSHKSYFSLFSDSKENPNNKERNKMLPKRLWETFKNHLFIETYFS